MSERVERSSVARRLPLLRFSLARFDLSSRLTPFLMPSIILALWQLGSSLGLIAETFLPAPTAVLTSGVRLTLSGELPGHIAISFRRAVSGLLLGGSIAFAFGLMNGLSKGAERLTDSTLQMVRNIPNLR